MTMDPLHRIRCRERQQPREHLVQRHAERIEIGARVDRAIHPTGLLWRHIREGPRDDFRRHGWLMFVRQLRSNAEAGQANMIVAIDEHVCRFDVLMNETASMYMA